MMGGIWDHLRPDQLAGAGSEQLSTGHRVARLGTVSFVRSGFARVRWDDGTVSDEWAADLIADAHPRFQRDRERSTEEDHNG